MHAYKWKPHTNKDWLREAGLLLKNTNKKAYTYAYELIVY